MAKIIIKGNFTIETDLPFVKNMKQPFEAVELEIAESCPMFVPVKCHRMTSASSVQSKNINKANLEVRE